MSQDREPSIEVPHTSESSAHTLEELRKRMEQTLVQQQQHRRTSNTGVEGHSQRPKGSSPGGTGPRPALSANPPSPSEVARAASCAESNSSGATLKGISRTPDAHVPHTPSYPFPIMQPHSNDNRLEDSHADASSNGKAPNTDKKERVSKAPGTIEMNSSNAKPTAFQSAFLPPGAPAIVDDPLYPSPSLYDVILKLNADPGLESWWTNVIEILQTHFGAERASLAVPGDSTDLENVPWGQKATFNVDRVTDLVDLPQSDALNDFDEGVLPHEEQPSQRKREESGHTPTTRASKLQSSSRRPSLVARHSFAGFGKEKKSRPRERPSLSTRDKSLLELTPRVPSDERSVDSIDATISSTGFISEDPLSKPAALHPGPAPQSSPLVVFTFPRALETEVDPLIKRTGIVRLFGRSKPAVLTREYAYGPAESSSRSSEITTVHTPNDTVQTTPANEPRRGSVGSIKEGAAPTLQSSRHRHAKSTTLAPPIPLPNKKDTLMHFELYEEYEQAPPSPWSLSPAPSPAPRVNAEQNPFFTSHAVDEDAFARDPPSHDYSQAQPVAAIGVDRSKTIVHVPLLHAMPSRTSDSETLRFPVAVISFRSSIIPYPANLRYSLMYLIPHLTTSYSLAQQYSQLEKQVSPGMDRPRFGRFPGLGGTFSDASSELELVAGLSGQVMTEDGSLSARASISSPDEPSTVSKFSPSLSLGGTPGVESTNLGPASEPSATPGFTQGSELSDGYFSLHRVRSSAGQAVSTRGRGSRTRQNLLLSMPTSPDISRTKSRDDEITKDSSTVEPSSHPQETGRLTGASLFTRTPSRTSSTTPVVAQLYRESPPISSEHVFQLMLNSIPLHLFLAKGQSGEVIWTNSKFDAYRRSQSQGHHVRHPWQNIHPSELESISRQWAKALQSGSQFTERVRVRRFNDESAYRWFIFRANPLLSPTGQVVSWIGSFLDIHEQHVAELQAAQEREVFATDAKYRALANSIPQVVFEATELRGLISANEQWHLYTGQPVEEAMNFGFTKHVHRDDLEKCGVLSSEMAEQKPAPKDQRESVTSPNPNPNVNAGKVFSHGVTPALKELVNQGVVAAQKDENGRVFYTTELRLRSKGADYRWHLVRLLKVETSNFGNGEASWYGTCTDINDRKLLERELNKAMQKLNKEMESKTKFFSNMSHEIRTPLNGILGTIPFILDTQLDSDQRRMLDTIQNSSTNLRELVDNILDVSRVEAGKMNLISSWFHVRSVLEDVIDTISSRAIDKGLEINYLMDGDVPATVVGDRFRIRQVLINLMGNAVKFTASGEIYTKCSVYHDPSVSVKDSEMLLNFEVVDTGKGFSTADAERLMQRFSQIGGSASQQHAGSGLGLFLSKQLVEMHGGKLTPSSTEGQGAKFSFYVKVDAPRHDNSHLTRQTSDISSTAIATSLGSQYGMPLVSNNSSDSQIVTLKDLSPAHDLSPLVGSSSSSHPSVHSGSDNRSAQSSASSAVPTPEYTTVVSGATRDPLPLGIDPSNATTFRSGETIHPSVQSTPTLGKVLPSGLSPPTTYSVLILCPLDHAREAIKQHIEQVIPLEVPAVVFSLPDVEDWKDLMHNGDFPTMSHLILNLPGTDDVLEVMQHVQDSNANSKLALVIISDLYQKREINAKIEELISSGIRVDTVPKPVKPSTFSSIFDPDSRRDLSKDRNQDMAREVNNNFKTMSKIVKEVIGKKGYRILLVEDDETNRMVRYNLDETASGFFG